MTRTRFVAPLALLGLLGLAMIAPDEEEARAIEPDKVSHFAGGVASGGIATALANEFVPEHRLATGIFLGTVPGLIVEIVDSTGHAGFSGTDRLADFVGSMVGAMITDTVVLRFFVDKDGDDKAYGVAVDSTF